MRTKRQVAFLLALVLIAGLAIPGMTALASQPSAWAEPEMNAANMEGLLTANAAKDFRRELTRLEFCELVVAMSEKILGQELPVPDSDPFTDSRNVAVLKAYKYGIVDGVGGSRFAPESKVQRQQLVTMIIRAVRKLETDLGKTLMYSSTVSLPFRDNSAIDSYATESVRAAYANGLVKGDDLNNFNPKSSIKSEECVAIVIRGYNKMQTTLNLGLTQAQLVDKTYENLTIGLAYGDTPEGVTQAVLLPTSGAGGAVITWTSSNSSVISTAGAVNPGSRAVTVTLAATIRLGANVRTKVFSLTTSPYSGDRALVENAYAALDIYYRGVGDSADSVTGSIVLPATVLGLPVTWTAGNPAVVSAEGQVTVPKDDSTATASVTAKFGKGTQTKTKTFILKVQNPLYHSRSVSLHSVTLGMTYSEVTARLGTPKRTVQTATNETWSVFHTNYSGFIAVAFQNSKVAAVYSMASTAASQLRGSGSTVITAAQANAVSGVTARSYTDPGNSNRQYALMIADSKSTILSSRTLTAAGIEVVIFELVNGYRTLYGRAALVWNDKLAASARAHSTEMGIYDYFEHTGRSGSTYQSRAAAQGYEYALTADENIAAGQTGPFEMLSGWVGSTDNRNALLAVNYTVLGVGFSGGHSGTHKTYCTQVFGTLVPISSVSTPASVAVGANATQNISLILLPSGYNETVTVASSNTGIFTVTGASSSLIYTIRGVKNGSAHLTVRGNTSGVTLSIPVTVGDSAYATSMTLSGTHLVGLGDTLQLVPAMTPASGPIISWSSSNASYATVSAGSGSGVIGLVKGQRKTGSSSPVTITASVPKSGTGNITQTAKVYVDDFSITALGSTTLNLGGTNTVTLTRTGFTADTDNRFSVSWTSSNPAVATVNANGIVTGIGRGTADIQATATRSGWGGSIMRTIRITVTGTADYPTDFTLSPDLLVLGRDRSTADLTVNYIPSDAKNKTVIYSSADESVAKVTPGNRVEMVAPGATTIAAEVHLSATGLFQRKTLPVYVVGVTMDPLASADINHQSWIEAGAAVNAASAIAPQLTVAWSSSAPSIASIGTSNTQGKVRIMGEAPGTAVITVTVSYGGVKITSDTVTVTVQGAAQSQPEG